MLPTTSIMAANQPLHPFRDINLLVSPSHYAFKSASSSSAPTLIVDRPTGDLRLDYASNQNGARRVSSISGILGILSLKLGALRWGHVGFAF